VPENQECRRDSFESAGHSISVTCVKWGSGMSRFFRLVCGIRHRVGFYHRIFFAAYIDDIVRKVTVIVFCELFKESVH